MMQRRTLLQLGGSALALAACSPGPEIGPDGTVLPFIHWLDPTDTVRLRGEMLEGVNVARQDVGARPLTLDPALTDAAVFHTTAMAASAQVWHGEAQNDPVARGARAGYPGVVLGETLSATYGNGAETLTAWLAQADTRSVLTNPQAEDLGIGFYQDETGKVWWSLILGNGATA